MESFKVTPDERGKVMESFKVTPDGRGNINGEL